MPTGTIIEFDGHVGLGRVRDDDGRELTFHCTAIADGSRSVPEGARATFRVVPGHLGRWEAVGVETLTGGEGSAPDQ